MKVTAEEIQRDWNKLIKIIETTFQDERKEKLLKMYEHFKDRLLLAPASGIDHFHNAFPGGYLKHILSVIQFSVKMFKLWKECGAYIDYTKEEIIFASMHHDLGKLGDLENDHYVPNPSEWHRKNQGKIYTANSDIQFMNTFDRTMMILAHFGISLSTNELLGIKEEKQKGRDLVALASYRRAISNFVSIVTGKSIPVEFNSSDNSYTTGEKVVLGSNLNDKNFDVAVGLALHEGSHIKLTDFSTLLPPVLSRFLIPYLFMDSSNFNL